MLMSGVAVAISAGVAAAGLGVSIYQGQKAATAQEHALNQQKRAQTESVAAAKSQQRESEQATAMANRREPDVASIMSAAAKQGGDGKATEQKLTFDGALRIWRGRECLTIAELIAEGAWPASGKKSLNAQSVLLGLTWKPTPDGIFQRFHTSDIWLDDASIQRAAKNQTETHTAFIRGRWMPAFVDTVEYGKFGRATVTVTLFGGMDPTLYADFNKDIPVMINGAENTLKHDGGHYGPGHLASRGSILDVVKTPGAAPMGSSGIHVRFETDLIIEGIRPGRVVRIHPKGWPDVVLPREEYLGDGPRQEDRFPSPAIFPKYNL
jgi:hypothetical protein